MCDYFEVLKITNPPAMDVEEVFYVWHEFLIFDELLIEMS